jgi:hypothetical protein
MLSIRNFSENASYAKGAERIFFVTAKILELLAIPLLTVVTVAWAPVALPLFVLALAVKACGGRSSFDTIRKCAFWPTAAIGKMWECTLKGFAAPKIDDGGISFLKDSFYGSRSHSSQSKDDDVHCGSTWSQDTDEQSFFETSNDSRGNDVDSARVSENDGPAPVEIAQDVGLVVTAFAVAVAVVTVVLFFTTALIPFLVLWPVAIACGCVAILGLVAFAIARWRGEKPSSNGVEDDHKEESVIDSLENCNYTPEDDSNGRSSIRFPGHSSMRFPGHSSVCLPRHSSMRLPRLSSVCLSGRNSVCFPGHNSVCLSGLSLGLDSNNRTDTVERFPRGLESIYCAEMEELKDLISELDIKESSLIGKGDVEIRSSIIIALSDYCNSLRIFRNDIGYAWKTVCILVVLPVDLLIHLFGVGNFGYQFLWNFCYAFCNDDICLNILQLLIDRLLPEEAAFLLHKEDKSRTELYDLLCVICVSDASSDSRIKYESEIEKELAALRLHAEKEANGKKYVANTGNLKKLFWV